MFIVVVGKTERLKEVPAYLYDGQSVIEGPIPVYFGSAVIVDTGSADDYRAQYVTDRIASGMFGSKLFATLDEAYAHINELK